MLEVAAIYAAGFLIRPLGDWYFVRYADRHGCRAAMIASVLPIGAGPLLVAPRPTYTTIGAAAPALLPITRLMQGFLTGGQFGTAAAYRSEIAEPDRRGSIGEAQTMRSAGLLVFAVLGIISFCTSVSVCLGNMRHCPAVARTACTRPFDLSKLERSR